MDVLLVGERLEFDLLDVGHSDDFLEEMRDVNALN